MTPKQSRFVDEYLIDLNATQAAIRAGYSRRTAGAQGEALLKNPEIAQFVKFEMDERAKRTKVTADRVIEELGKIAFFDIRKAFRPDGTLMSVDEMDADARAVIISLDVTDLHDREGAPTGRISKIKLADKLGALTLLMRHMGLLNDKLKIQGDAENPLVMLIKEVQGNAIKPVPSHLLEHDDHMRPVQ